MWLQSRDGPLAPPKGETWIWVRFTRWKSRGLVQGSHVFSGVVLLHKRSTAKVEKKADAMTLICIPISLCMPSDAKCEHNFIGSDRGEPARWCFIHRLWCSIYGNTRQLHSDFLLPFLFFLRTQSCQKNALVCYFLRRWARRSFTCLLCEIDKTPSTKGLSVLLLTRVRSANKFSPERSRLYRRSEASML